MHVLISGATGFVGRTLAAALVNQGHQVSAISRSPGSARRELAELSGCISWDDVESRASESLVGVDAIVHLAGESVVGRWSVAKKDRIRSSRVQTTRMLVHAMQQAEQAPAVLVSASAVGYYGETGDSIVDETSAPGEDFLARVCVSWEEAARLPERFRVVTTRIGLVLGTAGGALRAMLPAFRMGLGGRLGSGRQWWPWVHVNDVVGVIEHALHDPSTRGALNVVSPDGVQQKAFAATLGKLLHRPVGVPAPAPLLKLALGEFSHELLASRRVHPKATLASGYVFRFRELDHALRNLLAPS